MLNLMSFTKFTVGARRSRNRGADQPNRQGNC